MKHFIVLIVCFSFLTFTNCSISNDNNSDPQVIRVLWNLKNVSGGVAGVDNDFTTGKIVWEFNENTKKVTVTNSNTDNNLEDGLDSGTYSYDIITSGTSSKAYLVIASNEIGSITVTETQLVINQNETSTGPVADGYIYTFNKTVIVEN